MGFLSAYAGTRRVDVGGGYWIEVKECLTAIEKHRAEKALASPMLDMNGNGSAALDSPAFRTEMMCASIVGWNLDEDDGTVWLLAPDRAKRANIARLPASVFDTVYQVVDELNAPQSAAERSRFPAAGVGGDPDGDGRPGEPEDVQPGAGAVAAPGAAPE